MNKSIYLFILVFFIACQNQPNKNNAIEDVKDTVVDEKSLILLGGEKQYVEMTGVHQRTPSCFFYMAVQGGHKPLNLDILMKT
jgi:hypothetical protein